MYVVFGGTKEPLYRSSEPPPQEGTSDTVLRSLGRRLNLVKTSKTFYISTAHLNF